MEDVTKLDQGALRDFWAECEDDFLRWHLSSVEHDPEKLTP
jgi:hypothetical protein